MTIKSINEIIIYVHHDGTHDIHVRKSSIDDDLIEEYIDFFDVLEKSRTNSALRDRLEQVKVVYELIK